MCPSQFYFFSYLIVLSQVSYVINHDYDTCNLSSEKTAGLDSGTVYRPAAAVVSFNLGDDFDASARLSKDVADVGYVLRSSNERRKHDVNLDTSTK